MIVTVPHAGTLRAEVRRALMATGHAWNPVEVGDDDQHYWRVLRGLWDTQLSSGPGAGFIIVEHDIIVRPDSLDELELCSASWCAFTYPYLDGNAYPGLGCAKFAGDLVGRLPFAIDGLGEDGDGTHPPRHWCRLDGWLRAYLYGHGETCHVHEPPLEHLNTTGRPTHRCQ